MGHTGTTAPARKVLALLLTAVLVLTGLPIGQASATQQGQEANASSLADEGAPSDESASASNEAEPAGEAGGAAAGAADDAAGGTTVDPSSSSEGASASGQDASSADAGAPALDGSSLDEAALIDAPELSADEHAALAPMAAPAPGRATDPAEGDGSKIESVTVSWITKNADGSSASDRLSLAPTTDDAFDVRMRLNAAFSGQHDYEAGDLQISVPKNLFTNRDGTPAGSMTLSVPEAPDARATFAYSDEGDTYVLTNTRKLSAATSVMFEFTVRGLVPHDLVGDPSQYVSDRFEATAQLTTHTGSALTKSSNAIDATIDTSEQVTKAENSVALLSESWDDSSWPAELKPANADDYVYCDFYSWATVAGNQAFTLEATHDASATGRGVIMLGMKDQDGNVWPAAGQSASSSVTLQEAGYHESDQRNFYLHAYIAVPKSQVPDNGTYDFKDTVTYRLTSTDDHQTTTASAEAKKTYAPLAFMNPKGHYNVFKYGSIPVKEDDTMRSWGDAVPLALNDLRDGRDVTATWQVETFGFPAPWTWADENGDGKMSENELEKKPVKMTTDDYSVQFDHQGTDLTSKDFEFATLEVTQPSVYRYQKFKEPSYGYTDYVSGYVSWRYIAGGEFGYKRVDDANAIPDVDVYGQVDGGSWTKYATISWKSGTVQATTENGASFDGKQVVFPGNVTDVRTETNSTASGVWYKSYPTVRLKATDAVRQRVDNLYKNSTSPSTILRNTSVMHAYAADGSEIITCGPKTADDKLSGASLGVRADKTLTYENDIPNRTAKLHYTTKVSEQSNLVTLDQYNEALSRGVFGRETAGTFYDLLPQGVVPDVSSVRLRDGDAVQDVRTIENYQGSGRTLLVVKAALSPQAEFVSASASITGEAGYCDTPQLEFDAVYSWENISDLGADLNNVIAFESGNASLGTMRGLSGEPDDPLAGNNETSKGAVAGVETFMTDLDPDRDDPSFVYANCDQKVAVDTNAITSLSKRVSVNNDGVYGDGLGEYDLNVYEGGAYTYRLRMQNDTSTKARDMVIYDNLENYAPTADKTEDTGDVQWRGTLQSIDVSQLTSAGIAPVVYYSTKAGLTLDDTENRADMDLADTSTWSQTRPADASSITAIAIDCSKRADGTDFVLDAGASIVAYAHMKAPYVSEYASGGEAAKWFDTDLAEGQVESDDGGLAGGAHAYNNVTMLATTISTQTGATSEHQLVRNDYTKVGLKNGSIAVHKEWKDADDQDGVRPESVTVHLLADGSDTGRSAVLSDENEWRATFDNLARVNDDGHVIDYTFAEDAVSGYVFGVSRADGATGADATEYTVTNIHEPEKTQVSGTKTWDDNGDAAGKRPDSVRVDLYKNGTKYASKTVSANENGEWSYTFTELDKYSNHGTPVKYEVKEDTYYAGYVPSVASANVTNRYDPFGDLTISKKTIDATDASADKDFTFRVTLTNADGGPNSASYAYTTSDGRSGSIANGGVLTLKGGQTATIKHLPSETTYRVTEDDTPGFTLTGKTGDEGAIKAGQTAQASFTNTYTTSGSVRLSATKSLDGHAMRANQFRFDVLDESGTVIRTASNTNEGAVTFGAIRYSLTDVGKTYTYTIREQNLGKGGYTYDEHLETVTVAVVDNGDGTITATPTYDSDGATFKNDYHASGSLALKAWKELPGRDLADGEFTFDLLDSDGTVVGTATNKADGTIEFPALEFTEKDAGRSFTYTAQERKGSDPTVTYSEQRFSYTVTVRDNGDGTLSFDQETAETPVFSNELVPGDLRIEKRVQSGDPDQEFTFHVQLAGEEGQQLPSGTVEFEREQLSGATASASDATEGAAAGAADTVVAADANADATEGAATGVADAHAQDADSAGDAPADAANAAVNDSGSAAEPASSDAAALSQGFASFASTAATATARAAAPNASNYPAAGATMTKSGAWGAATWKLYSDGTLVVSGALDDIDIGSNWIDASAESQVKTVKFEGAQAGSNFQYAFTSWDNLTTVVGSLDTSRTTNMQGLFHGCSSLSYVDASSWDTSKVVTMGSVFSGCASLSYVDVSGWNTSQVTDCGFIFNGCSSLTSLDVSGWDLSRATDMECMFQECGSLASLDVSQWRVSRVTTLSHIFFGCSSLLELDVSGWRTPSLMDMNYAFYDCSKLTTLDVSGWDTSNGANAPGMFYGCSSLTELDLSGFDSLGYSSAMSGFFYGCSSLERVTLSAEWWFGRGDLELPLPPTNATYDGTWVREDGTAGPFTPAQLTSNWQPSLSGTWVWHKVPKDYTVAFSANATDATGSMSPQTWTIGTFGTIPSPSFKRFNYAFAGWNTQPDGSGTSYAAGQKLTQDLTSTAGSTVTLYAQWDKLDNTVDVTDGGFDITIHGNEAAVLKNIPAGVGYTVTEKTPAGWVLVDSSDTAGTIAPAQVSTASFVNDYRPGQAQATLSATKRLDGAPAKAGAFTFTLSEGGTVLQTKQNADGGGVVFDPITYAENGIHVYTITEVAGGDASIDYDAHTELVTVVVDDDGQGNRSAVVTYDSDGAAFSNTTKPGSLQVTKQVSGTTATDKTFTFRVDWNGGKTSDTFQLKAGETKTFDDLAVGTTYQVVETDLPDGYVQEGIVGGSGTIVAAQTATATVSNRYVASGSAVIQAKKTLEGGALSDGQFTFRLKDASGAVLSTASNAADGTVTFDPIEYGEAGTYDYTVVEVPGADDAIAYDESEQHVQVRVSDEGNGHLTTAVTYVGAGDAATFTNHVKPGTLRISKQVVNGTGATADKEFTFTLGLADAEGAALTGSYEYVKSDGSTGTVADGGTISLAGGQHVDVAVPFGTTYSVAEAEAPGFTSSATGATGTVSSQTPSEAVFTNTYAAAGSYAPTARKDLEGGTLAAGQFSFQLMSAEGQVLQTASNAADGSVTFGAIPYTEADDGKEFTYRIVEVNDGQSGIQYDGKVCIVKVRVTDRGDGTLETTASYDGADAVTFTNTVSPAVDLPETGGAGIVGGVACGFALVAVSIGLVLRRRRA